MRASQSILLTAILALVGCSKLTGGVDPKVLDAQAIGYACRVSQKAPEDCMKENEAHSPTSILNGWKAADKDIEERVIDPSMGKKPAIDMAAHSAPAATESGGKAAVEKTVEKVTASKDEKPAATAKPDKAAAEKKAGH